MVIGENISHYSESANYEKETEKTLMVKIFDALENIESLRKYRWWISWTNCIHQKTKRRKMCWWGGIKEFEANAPDDEDKFYEKMWPMKLSSLSHTKFNIGVIINQQIRSEVNAKFWCNLKWIFSFITLFIILVDQLTILFDFSVYDHYQPLIRWNKASLP